MNHEKWLFHHGKKGVKTMKNGSSAMNHHENENATRQKRQIPSGKQTGLLLKMAQSKIVDLPSNKKWWIFP